MQHLSLTDTPAPSAPTSTSTATPAPVQKYSCTLCARRKVRCDRQLPQCGNCAKACASACEYKEPAPPQRRRKRGVESAAREGPAERELRRKVERLEGLLRKLGVDVAGGARDKGEEVLGGRLWERKREDGEEEEEGEAGGGGGGGEDRGISDVQPVISTQGRLVKVEGGHTRYVENPLVAGLNDEFGPSADDNDGSSSNGYTDEDDAVDLPFTASSDISDSILGWMPPSITLTQLHPGPAQIQWLLQQYTENVDPFFKGLHVPTTSRRLLAAAQDLQSVGKADEALMFGIYSATAYTLTEEQCVGWLGMGKATAQNTWLYALRQALVKADFLRTSDVVVLEAFVLFLFIIRLRWDPYLVWVITGLASRIGQKMGLHRLGSSLNLSPFETERRRRLWIQISQMDGMVAEVSGPGKGILEGMEHVGRPLNINDEEFWPEMVELPQNRDGASSIMFTLLRLDMGRKWSQMREEVEKPPHASYWQKKAELDEFENYIELTFLRFCEPLKPAHMLGSIICRSGMISLRLGALQPRWKMSGNGPSLTEEEFEMAFSWRLKILEYYGLIADNKAVHKFRWVYTRTFQWDQLIYVLNTVRSRKMIGEAADKAWNGVQGAFSCNKDIILRRKRPLHRAVCRLALKAWEERETHEPFPPQVPECISELRRIRANSSTNSPMNLLDLTQTQSATQMDQSLLYDENMMGVDTLDWSQWQDLVKQDRQQVPVYDDFTDQTADQMLDWGSMKLS